MGRDHYQSQFVVHEDNTAAGIADLDGLLWAYPSTYSVSGFLVPLGMMEIEEVAAGAVLETDDHSAAITAVSSGDADFATTFVRPALPGNVRVLVESPPIPNDPVAFGADFPTELRAAVETALIEVAATPAGGAAFRVLDRYMEGISPAIDSEWDWLRTVLDAAGFGIDDLW